MKRSGPIQRKTPLKAGRPLKRTPMKRRRQSDPPELVAAKKEVAARSGGFCEMKVEGICTTYANDFDHVKNRSQLGEHSAENGLAACRPCHRFKTENPNAASDLGIYKRGWE